MLLKYFMLIDDYGTVLIQLLFTKYSVSFILLTFKSHVNFNKPLVTRVFPI